ncbi:hypothetical protein ACJX0J_039153 [Zea mays]
MNGVVMQNKNIRKIAKRYEGAYFVFCCFWATMDFMLINIFFIIMSIKISFSDLANCMRVFQIWCLDDMFFAMQGKILQRYIMHPQGLRNLKKHKGTKFSFAY